VPGQELWRPVVGVIGYMKKLFRGLLLITVMVYFGCNTNKPAEEVEDAQERVKTKIEDAREEQKEAAEETGEATPQD
jgi:hypothetical protein